MPPYGWLLFLIDCYCGMIAAWL